MSISAFKVHFLEGDSGSCLPGMWCCAWSLSRVQLMVAPWAAARQAPRSTGFSRPEYWSGLPFLPPGDLPHSGIEPRSSALQTDSSPPESPRKPHGGCKTKYNILFGVWVSWVSGRQVRSLSFSYIVSSLGSWRCALHGAGVRMKCTNVCRMLGTEPDNIMFNQF